MEIAILEDNLELPEIGSIAARVDGHMSQESFDRTRAYLASLKLQGIDISAVVFTNRTGYYDDNVTHEDHVDLTYVKSGNEIVKPELLDDVKGVRAFERTMSGCGSALTTFDTSDGGDSLEMRIYQDMITVEQEMYNNEFKLLMIDVDGEASRDHLFLKGELAQILSDAFRPLEVGQSGILLSEESENYYELTTASTRIIGEAAKEADGALVQSWLKWGSTVFVSRLSDDILIVHGVCSEEYDDPAAGTLHGVIRA